MYLPTYATAKPILFRRMPNGETSRELRLHEGRRSPEVQMKSITYEQRSLYRIPTHSVRLICVWQCSAKFGGARAT